MHSAYLRCVLERSTFLWNVVHNFLERMAHHEVLVVNRDTALANFE